MLEELAVVDYVDQECWEKLKNLEGLGEFGNSAGTFLLNTLHAR